MKRKPSTTEVTALKEQMSAAADQIESRRLDRLTLTALVKRLEGRRPRPLAPRLQRCRIRVYRDPRDLVFRYLRRFRKGHWHRGGSHVARYHGGPGIGFQGFRNDRCQKIKPLFLDR
jgi:hypothetical protein